MEVVADMDGMGMRELEAEVQEEAKGEIEVRLLEKLVVFVFEISDISAGFVVRKTSSLQQNKTLYFSSIMLLQFCVLTRHSGIHWMNMCLCCAWIEIEREMKETLCQAIY